MNQPPERIKNKLPETKSASWGPKLFIAVLLALLAFFYWLLIYSGGVTVYHG
ncbi:MAG: hypothetical protein KZQ77_03715 [Candidatus Thiodiazotropha sp. (ex Notomyrtea botanica)]|nr:hypothetical protein [Candidatus Thiodiazotropha sp. (ex Notomyrtea botanica)]